MLNPNDVLVVTTSSHEGLNVKRFLKPVSAHIVAGTDLVKEFITGFTDIFGGRSETYQKEISSLYAEAIERIKIEAFQIGANGVIGLQINMDEISGKGKSMFMLSAIGTAVILENKKENKLQEHEIEKPEAIGADKLMQMSKRKQILKKAAAGELELDELTWIFITENHMSEIFPEVIKIYASLLAKQEYNTQELNLFEKHFLSYVIKLPEEARLELLYGTMLSNPGKRLVRKLADVIVRLRLFNFTKIVKLLSNDNFELQKTGLELSTSDKQYYNRDDIKELLALSSLIGTTFKERGKRSMKKQLLSSKEKEIWTCECGGTNDINSYCIGCECDIYGFRANDINPSKSIEHLTEKINLINEIF